jgi:DNA-binding LacI/PurR family transcriptional regulator
MTGSIVLYQKIKNELEVRLGQLTEGARLPSLRQLATQLNCSVGPVQRAVDELCLEQKLTKVHGTGIFKRRSNRTLKIAILGGGLNNSFSANLIHAVLEALAGYENLFYYFLDTRNTLEGERKALKQALDLQTDGILFKVSDDSIRNDRLGEVSRKTPLVVLDGSLETVNADNVLSDDFIGSYKAVSTLISLGHTKIAYFAPVTEKCNSKLRRLGYIKALEDAGLEVDPAFVFQSPKVDCGHAFAEMLNSAKAITAVACYSDDMALSVMEHMDRCGLRVPVDYSVFGYGNEYTLGGNAVSLSTVDQNIPRMGRVAVECLLDRIKVPGRQIREIKIPVELVINNSISVLSRAQPSKQMA